MSHKSSRLFLLTIVSITILFASAGLQAQQANTRSTGREVSANRLITFNGTLKDANGQPRLGTVGITFALYASQEGGEGLWRESQTVQTDEQGRYTILLGSTEKEGLPLEVFSTGKAQWLGVQVQGENEEPRVLLVAVPYALKAADADTVGGKPLSSFVLYEDLTKAMEKQTTPAMIVSQNAISGAGGINSIVKNGLSPAASKGVAAQASSHGGGPFYGNESGSNTWYGDGAGNATMTGTYNSLFGYHAGTSTTTGAGNSSFGYGAGNQNSTGNDNSFFGAGAGANNAASGNSFFGQNSGNANISGDGNSFFGSNAGKSNIYGYCNSFFGHDAGLNSTNDWNSFFGYNAGKTQGGYANSFFGAGAGEYTTTGGWNSFFGEGAGGGNTIGDQNTFVGDSAGNWNTTGSYNSYFGANTGMGGTNGTGSWNSFFGYSAGYVQSTGSNNSFFGAGSGQKNDTASDNSFFGFNAGANNETGHSNAFVGKGAGENNTSGYWNAFLGMEAGFKNAMGASNSFFGQGAGYNNIGGNNNAFFGRSAGISNNAEDNNSFIGAYSDGAAGITNATAIGYQAKVTQSNSLVLGSINGINNATADTKVGVGTTAPVSTLNVRSSTNVSPRGVTNEQYNDGMDGVQFRGRKARGTSTTPAAVQSGDVLGNYVFDGYDGAAFGTGVQIRPVTEEVWTSTAHGSYLALWTTPPGTTINTEKVRITGAGNVGIGTTNPTERLHVVGNIRATGSIYSQLAPETDVPDYVFESDYNLMSILELAKFIVREKHLPNVPKASEIKENGLNHGEFQMKLLEKIEELTLYTVQQAKVISQKDAEVAALNTRVAALEQAMERLAKER